MAEYDRTSRILSTLNPEHHERLLRLSGTEALPELPLGTAVGVAVLLEAGGSLLKSTRVVRELLKDVPAQKLRRLASNYCRKEYAKPFDNALILSKLSEPVLASVLLDVLEPEIARVLRGMGVDFAGATAERVFASATAEELLPHQKSVVRTAIGRIRDRRGFLVQMPTGAGKTTTALMMLIRSGLVEQTLDDAKFAFWLAPTKELVEQAATAFQSLWARYGSRTAYIHVANQKSEGEMLPAGAVIFATYQTAAAWNTAGKTTAYGRNSTFLVADEAHRALAPTYRNAITSLTLDGLKIGLTATPGRQAERSTENLELAKFFESQIIRASESEDEIADLQSQGVLSRLKRTVVHVRNSSTSLLPQTAEAVDPNVDNAGSVGGQTATLNQLAINDNRNSEILKVIHDRVEAGHRVIFFGCGVEHSRLLSATLLLGGVPAASIDALTSRSIRQEVVDRFRAGELKVLGNYTVFSAGFDAPGTDVVVITRPTASIVTYSQMIGRALRGPRMGGAATAEVIEFSDAIALSKESEQIYRHFDGYWVNSPS